MAITLKQPDKVLTDEDLILAWIMFDDLTIRREDVLEKDTFDEFFADLVFPAQKKNTREDDIVCSRVVHSNNLRFTTTEGFSARINLDATKVIVGGLVPPAEDDVL